MLLDATPSDLMQLTYGVQTSVQHGDDWRNRALRGPTCSFCHALRYCLIFKARYLRSAVLKNMRTLSLYGQQTYIYVAIFFLTVHNFRRLKFVV